METRIDFRNASDPVVKQKKYKYKQRGKFFKWFIRYIAFDFSKKKSFDANF